MKLKYRTPPFFLLVKLFLSVLLFSICTVAQAYRFKPESHEWITWPEYCKARYIQTNIGMSSDYVGKVSSDAGAKWLKILGLGFNHVHHYCAGLVWIARSRSMLDAQSREQALSHAIGEITYTFERVSPDFSLYSEMAAYLAQAFFGIGDTEKALDILRKAINQKPEKIPAYIALAEILMKSRKDSEALDVLLKAQKMATIESAELHYFLGHVYLRLNKFEDAKRHGKRAYELGYPLPGLRKMLQSKNLWK